LGIIIKLFLHVGVWRGGRGGRSRGQVGPAQLRIRTSGGQASATIAVAVEVPSPMLVARIAERQGGGQVAVHAGLGLSAAAAHADDAVLLRAAGIARAVVVGDDVVHRRTAAAGRRRYQDFGRQRRCRRCCLRGCQLLLLLDGRSARNKRDAVDDTIKAGQSLLLLLLLGLAGFFLLNNRRYDGWKISRVEVEVFPVRILQHGHNHRCKKLGVVSSNR